MTGRMRTTVILGLLAVFAACGGDTTPEAAEAPPGEAAAAPAAVEEARADTLPPLTLGSAEVGDLTLELTQCAVEGYPMVNEEGDATDRIEGMELVGGHAYVIDEDKEIRRFTVTDDTDSCSFVADDSYGDNGSIALRYDPMSISVGGGRLVASSGSFEGFVIEDGAVAFECGGRPNQVVVSPDGRNALGYYSNNQLHQIEIGDDGCTIEAWDVLGDTFERLATVAYVGDDIAVAGALTEEVEGSDMIIQLLDAQGRPKVRFGRTDPAPGAPDRFGSVQDIEVCRAGLCVIDYNFDTFSIWRLDGTNVGGIRIRDLADGLKRANSQNFEVPDGGSTGWMAIYYTTDDDQEGAAILRLRGLG